MRASAFLSIHEHELPSEVPCAIVATSTGWYHCQCACAAPSADIGRHVVRAMHCRTIACAPTNNAQAVWAWPAEVKPYGYWVSEYGTKRAPHTVPVRFLLAAGGGARRFQRRCVRVLSPPSRRPQQCNFDIWPMLPERVVSARNQIPTAMRAAEGR